MPGEKQGTLNLEELEKKDELSSTDTEALEAEVLADREESEKTPEQIEKEAEEVRDKEITERADLDTRAEVVGLEAGSSVEEIEKAEEAREEEEGSGDKDKNKVKDTPAKPSEEEAEKAKKEQEDIVAKYAKDNSMSAEDAQAELESINKVADKYEKDPNKLAKANLYLQRSFNESQEKLKKLEETKQAQPALQLTVDNVIKVIDEGTLKDPKGNVLTRDSIIAQARENDPETYDSLDDETTLRLAAKELMGFLQKTQEKNLADVKVKLNSDAKAKREKLISELPEEVKRFLPDIKDILGKASDQNVMNEKFDMSVYVAYAKGLHYDEDVKEAKEKALKEGKEEAEIVGEKIPGGGGSAPAKTGGSKKLTELQKTRALEMYEGTEITEKQKFEWFAEYLKDNPEADPELAKKK